MMSTEIARVIFFLLGLIAFLEGMRLNWRNLRATNWRKTEGEIIESRVTGIDEDFIAVKYHYAVDGIHYVGERYAISNTSVGDAAKIVQRLAPGTKVMVLYNPAKPQECALEPNHPVGPILFIGVGVLFMVIALLVDFSAW